MNKQWLSWCACAPAFIFAGAVQGQAASEESVYQAASAPASGSAAQAPLGVFYGGLQHRVTRSSSAAAYPGNSRLDERPPWVSIVTLPPEPTLGPPGRSHHALSLRSEGSTRALRSMGFDVIDCTTRLRFPSRFRLRSVNAEGGFEAAAQLSWQCRF